MHYLNSFRLSVADISYDLRKKQSTMVSCKSLWPQRGAVRSKTKDELLPCRQYSTRLNIICFRVLYVHVSVVCFL